MPDAGQVRSILTQALSVWERNSKLTFREVYSDQADIQVLFARMDHGDGYKFDGPGLILAHAFYPGVGRGGDAHFDADENWLFTANDTNEAPDFLGVAVHEFGHSLGLGHTTDVNAIMYPWYQGYKGNNKLPDYDRNAIQHLYGSKEKTWGPFKPQQQPRTTTSTTTTMRPLVYYPEQRRPYNSPNDGQPPTRTPPYDPNNPRRTHHHRTHTQQQPNYPRHTTTSTTTTTTMRPAYRPYTDAPRTYTPRRYKPRKQKPDTCMTSYDAISIIHGELFIFKGQFVWRVGASGLYHGYPTETRNHWKALPENFVKIDAVYENRERQIVFFVGRQYYVFASVNLVAGYPQPLSSLGLPESLTHLDAAFVWGHNNHTYLLSGTLYWRLDDDDRQVLLDYPRDMSIWWGIGYNIDAAFQYTNGKTYFFKGLGYWEFSDDRMSVAHRRQKVSAHKWMNCPRGVNEVDEETQIWNSPLISEPNKTDSADDENENELASKAVTYNAGKRITLYIAVSIAVVWTSLLCSS